MRNASGTSKISATSKVSAWSSNGGCTSATTGVTRKPVTVRYSGNSLSTSTCFAPQRLDPVVTRVRRPVERLLEPCAQSGRRQEFVAKSRQICAGRFDRQDLRLEDTGSRQLGRRHEGFWL